MRLARFAPRRASPRPFGILGVALLLAASASTGCTWKGGPDASGPSTRADAGPREDSSDVWRPRPTTLRIFPSSRFVTAESETGAHPVLEARVELTDAMGDAIKAPGRFRLDVHGASPSRDPIAGPRLYTWDVPVRTLAQQRTHYDSVTGSYLFRLKLYEPQTARRGAGLRVVFTPADGSRLEASAKLTPQQ